MALKRVYRPRTLIKTVTLAVTPEALSADTTLRVYGIQFVGQKAFGTDNTGNIIVQVNNGTTDTPDYQDALTIEPGQMSTWGGSAFLEGFFILNDFKIKVATNGDGVRILYSTFAQETA